MAVVTIIDVADTADLTLPADTWASMVNGPITVTGLGGGVTIQGYMYNVDFNQVEMRIVVDGTEQVVSATPQIMINKTLSVGSHTIDLQGLSLNSSSVVNTRGLLAFTL